MLLLWVTIPFLAVGAAPLLYLLMSQLGCCGIMAQMPRRVHVRMLALLTAIDQFGFQHSIPIGGSPVLKKTVVGGAVSVLAFGCILAVAASLIAQFVVANLQPQLPVIAPVADSYASLPARHIMLAEGDVSGLPVGTAAGLVLQISTMGPYCNNVAWQPSSINLLAGSFKLTTLMDAATGYARHTFNCVQCAFRSISNLDLCFDATCQSFIVKAFAVGADGTVTVAAYDIAYSGAPSTAIAVGFEPTLQVQVDVATNTSTRGFSVAAQAAGVPLNTNASTILLRILLPLNPTYVNYQVRYDVCSSPTFLYICCKCRFWLSLRRPNCSRQLSACQGCLASSGCFSRWEKDGTAPLFASVSGVDNAME